MKIKKILCVVLACLMLAGCGSRKTADNMEDAVDALVWEDYDTAFAQADAFLRRMPDNKDAEAIRQTAAWGKLNARPLDIKLSKCKWSQLDYGFTVENMPAKGKSEIQITGYWVGMDYAQETIGGHEVITFFLRSMTFDWTDGTGTTYGYEIKTPENLNKKNLEQSLLEQSYASDPIDEATRQLVIKQAAKVLGKSLEDVFSQIEKQTGLKPEHLGFIAWND